MVSSRGRPIGSSDLGFIRVSRLSLSGWFYPNSYGEQVMPVIAAVLPALQAYLHRDVSGEDGKRLVQPDVMRSPALTEYEKALQQVQALDLKLHMEDGTLVPTEVVGIQDTEQLLALADLTLLTDDEEEWSLDDVEDWSPEEVKGWSPDDLLDDDFDDFWLDCDGDTILEGRFFDEVRARATDDEPTPFPRYQIHVLLADDANV
jgi:hypothetical protein